jgi:hypothetical protein
MKATKEQTATLAALAFAPSQVKSAIEANVTALEMKRGKEASCSSEQYGAILFMTLADLAIIAPEQLPAMMAAWDSFPKSPSAFRQTLEKTDEGATGKAVSSLIAKYQPKA